MFSDCTCEIRDNTYRFSTTSLSFERASTACRNEGGRLARFLTRPDYEKLNSCCSQRGEYWIDLVDRGNCQQNEPYRWGNTRACRNAAPLVVITQPNNSGCQSVTIRTGSQQVLPTARVIDCTQSQPFICQYLPPTTTTTATTTTSRALNNTRMARSTTTASFSSTQTSLAHPSNSQHMEKDSSSTMSIYNSGILAAIVVCAILLLLLLAFLYFWKYRRTDLKKLKNFGHSKRSSRSSIPNTKHSGQMQAHVYSNVDAPDYAIIEAQHHEFLNNRPNYVTVEDVDLSSDYQEINHHPSHIQASNDSENVINHGDDGTYSQTYSHVDKKKQKATASSDNSYSHIERRNYENMITEQINANATACAPIQAGTTSAEEFDSQKVEYTTVRPLDQPTEVYAVVNKPKKTDTSI